jgi:hypothetical protein
MKDFSDSIENRTRDVPENLRYDSFAALTLDPFSENPAYPSASVRVPADSIIL